MFHPTTVFAWMTQLTLRTLKYCYTNHGDQKFFSIRNHHQCLNAPTIQPAMDHDWSYQGSRLIALRLRSLKDKALWMSSMVSFSLVWRCVPHREASVIRIDWWQGSQASPTLLFDHHHPAGTRHRPDDGSMLGQRRRRWTNIDPSLGQCLVFAWQCPLSSHCSGLHLHSLPTRLTNLMALRQIQIRKIFFFDPCMYTLLACH